MEEKARKFQVNMIIYLPAGSTEDEEDVLNYVVNTLYKERYVYDCEIKEIKQDESIRPEVSE